MTNEFLTALRVQADALRTKISHAYHATGNPTSRATGPTPVTNAPVYRGTDFADLDAQSAKLLGMIDAEIKRGPTRQEYEAQMLDTRPLPGETAQQTANRLDAQNFHNPLVAKPV